jgi:hydroxylamine reductase
MFCYQCQETAGNRGCAVSGVCGKNPEVANLQDVLVYVTRGLSQAAAKLREAGKPVEDGTNHLVTFNLFLTITNANFDADAITRQVLVTVAETKRLLAALGNTDSLSDAALWEPKSKEEMLAKAPSVGVMATSDDDIRSLRWLIILGLKGMAAYAKHAAALGRNNEEIDAFLQQALAKTLDDSLTADDLISLTLETGKYGVDVMALLDRANTETYGNPEITRVNLGVRGNPGILIWATTSRI